jgi:hypothetical protein
VFIDSGLEDLVFHLSLDNDGNWVANWVKGKSVDRVLDGIVYNIKSFRP